jgi:hypothetical protein
MGLQLTKNYKFYFAALFALTLINCSKRNPRGLDQGAQEQNKDQESADPEYGEEGSFTNPYQNYVDAPAEIEKQNEDTLAPGSNSDKKVNIGSQGNGGSGINSDSGDTGGSGGGNTGGGGGDTGGGGGDTGGGDDSGDNSNSDKNKKLKEILGKWNKSEDIFGKISLKAVNIPFEAGSAN